MVWKFSKDSKFLFKNFQWSAMKTIWKTFRFPCIPTVISQELVISVLHEEKTTRVTYFIGKRQCSFLYTWFMATFTATADRKDRALQPKILATWPLMKKLVNCHFTWCSLVGSQLESKKNYVFLRSQTKKKPKLLQLFI